MKACSFDLIEYNYCYRLIQTPWKLVYSAHHKAAIPVSFAFLNKCVRSLLRLLTHMYIDDNGKRQVETDTSISQIVLPVSLFGEGVDARFFIIHYTMSTLFPLSEYLLNNNFTIASPVLGVSVVGHTGVDLTVPVIITLHIQIDVSASW